MIFQVSARNPQGKIQRFTRNSASEKALARTLFSEGYYVLKIEETSPQENKDRISLSRTEFLELTRTLGNLLRAELPISEVISAAVSTTSRPLVQEFYLRLTAGLEDGLSFSKAWEKTALETPPIYFSMLKVGETSGTLRETFKRLAEYLHNQKKIRDKVVSALTYPAIVMSVAILGMVLLTIFILPQFSMMIETLNARAAQELQSKTDFLELFGYTLLALLGVLTVGMLFLFFRRKDPRIRRFYSSVLLKLPLLGRFQKIFNSFYFVFSLENLIQGGFPMDKALKVSNEVLPNHLMKEEMEVITRSIEKGQGMSSAFASSRYFPPEFSQWMKIGEKTGQILPVLTQLRESFQEEIENTTQRFVNLVEPGIILLVGGLLVVMIMNFILPLFSMFGTAF